MAIGWGNGCDGLGFHCSGVSRSKIILVGGVHYGFVTVQGGGCARLVWFAGTDGSGLLPEAGNVPAAEHVDAAYDATINSFSFVALGGPDEDFHIENKQAEDTCGSIPFLGDGATISQARTVVGLYKRDENVHEVVTQAG